MFLYPSNIPTALLDSGAWASVAEIAEATETGRVIINLMGKNRPPMEILVYSSPSGRAAHQIGLIFGKEGAARFVENYDDSVKPAVYAARFKQFYDAALRGIPFENIRQVSDARRGLSLAAQKPDNYRPELYITALAVAPRVALANENSCDQSRKA